MLHGCPSASIYSLVLILRWDSVLLDHMQLYGKLISIAPWQGVELMVRPFALVVFQRNGQCLGHEFLQDEISNTVYLWNMNTQVFVFIMDHSVESNICSIWLIYTFTCGVHDNNGPSCHKCVASRCLWL